MSDAAWADYAVPGSPYVVYVHGGRIAGEGSVQGWDQLRSLLAGATVVEPAALRRRAAHLAAAGTASRLATGASLCALALWATMGPA